MKRFAGRCRGFPGVLLSRGPLRPAVTGAVSRCCPQPGYRSGCDQGPPGGDPRPAPLHGPGHPGDIEHDGIDSLVIASTAAAAGGAGPTTRRGPSPRQWKQACTRGVSVALKRGRTALGGALGGGPRVSASGRQPGPWCQAAQHPLPLQPLDVLLHVLSRLGRGRASVPGPRPPARSQQRSSTRPGPAAGARRPSARPRQRPGSQRGRPGAPTEHPRGPGPVQKGKASRSTWAQLSSRAIPALSPTRRVRAKSRAAATPDAAARRGRAAPTPAPAASALAPRRSPAQPGSPGRTAGPVSPPSPARKYPAPGLKLEPGDPIHYESNLVTPVRRFRQLEK